MKKLILDEFKIFENLSTIYGGVEDRTNDSRATIRTDSNGCQQADVLSKDKSSDVGTPICPSDSTSNNNIAILPLGGPILLDSDHYLFAEEGSSVELF